MTYTTNSGYGIYVGDSEDYGVGFVDPWGYLLHSEDISMDSANIEDGDSYRVRGFTHTLSIVGVLLEKDGLGQNRPPILYLKDRLANFFYNNTTQAIAMGSGLFASVPTDGVIWEPVSLKFQEGTYNSELRYSATLVYKKTPSAVEIAARTITVGGVVVWDGSNIEEKVSFDRATKKIVKTTTVSANIKSPTTMPWGDSNTQGTAMWFYTNIQTLISNGGSDERSPKYTDSQVSKNFDEQTVSYNFTVYEIVDYSDAGFVSPWGYITYSESIALEHSKLESTIWRRRGHTHTLNISGTLWRGTGDQMIHTTSATAKALKEQLAYYFYEDLPTALNMSGALFAAIPVNESQAVWEPISLSFGEGSFVEELKYSATIVYKRPITQYEVSNRTIQYFGIEFWDNSNVSVRTNYDRITKKVNETVSISGNIKCPDKMPWGDAVTRGTAKWFAAQVERLRDRVYTSYDESNIHGITDVEVTENYDEQVVSYNVTSLNTGLGDNGKKIKLFGKLWPALSDIQIQSTPLKDSHVVTRDHRLQTISLSFSVTAPEEIETMSDAYAYYQSALSLKMGHYYPPFENISDQPDPTLDYNFGYTGDWQIKTSDSTFNATRKTVRVSITATRILNPAPPVKISIVTGGSSFIWEQSSISKQFNSEIESLIFNESIGVNGQAQIPEDMTEAEAQVIVNEINALAIFDSSKYPGYKLTSKQAFYDKFAKAMTYSLQIKKLDFYDPFRAAGVFNSANDSNRSVSFSYGVLSGIAGIQFDINYEDSVSEDENGVQVKNFSVSGRLIARVDQPTPASDIQTTLDLLFNKYVTQHQKLYRNRLRLTSFSRGISTNKMEGRFTINFTDDGKGDVTGNGLTWYTFFLKNPKIDTEQEIPRWLTINDGISDGSIYQDQGFGVRRITLTGLIMNNSFTQRKSKMRAVIDLLATNGGYLEIGGVSGRVNTLRFSNEDLVKQTAQLVVGIEVQPRSSQGSDPVLSYS